mgnify:CR=1 FL=1
MIDALATSELLKYANLLGQCHILNPCSQAQPLPPVGKDTLLSELASHHQLFIAFDKISTDKPLKKGRLGRCYKEAYALSCINPDLVYCEGLAVPGGLGMFMPLEHAWCVHKKTKQVFDSVWTSDKAGLAYAGIPLSNHAINKIMLKTKCYGVLTSALYKIYNDRPVHEIVHPAFQPDIFN